MRKSSIVTSLYPPLAAIVYATRNGLGISWVPGKGKPAQDVLLRAFDDVHQHLADLLAMRAFAASETLELAIFLSGHDVFREGSQTVPTLVPGDLALAAAIDLELEPHDGADTTALPSGHLGIILTVQHLSSVSIRDVYAFDALGQTDRVYAAPLSQFPGLQGDQISFLDLQSAVAEGVTGLTAGLEMQVVLPVIRYDQPASYSQSSWLHGLKTVSSTGQSLTVGCALMSIQFSLLPNRTTFKELPRACPVLAEPLVVWVVRREMVVLHGVFHQDSWMERQAK